MKKLRNVLPLLMVFAFLVLILPSALRALDGNVYLIGEESYYHARMAQQIVDSGIPDKDTGVSIERDYVFSPYHVLLAFFALLFGAATASKAAPLLLGLLCVYLFYLILGEFKIKLFAKMVVACMLILSPVFIYAFAVSTPACLVLVLNLAGLLFLMRKGRFNAVLSLLCFGAVSFFGVSHAVVSAFIVFAYSFGYKKRLKRGYVILAVIIFVLFSYSLPVYLNTESTSFIHKDLLSSFISDLGSAAGFSVFALLLAIVGYVLIWAHKKKYYFVYAFSILLILASFFDAGLRIYANLVIVFLAGTAFVYFANMKWKLKILRDFTLLVLFCGLLFSAVNTAVDLKDSEPNTAVVNSLIWLKLNADEGDVVFSHHSNGFWIEFISGRQVVLDGLLEQTPDVHNLYFDSMQAFDTDDLDVARNILSKYGVKYVIVTRNMKEGIVWDEEGSGLDFLLSNAETFKKVQENSYVCVYEYIYGGPEQ